MEEELLVKRLENVDREIHLIIEGLRLSTKKHKKVASLEELNKLMEEDRILDVDSTELVREMRDKEYDL